MKQARRSVVGQCVFAVLLPLLACGCGRPIVRHPVPVTLINDARAPGMPPEIRAWGDQYSPEFERSLRQSIDQAKAAYGAHPPIDILALSGGGSQGAFGAGLLCGWTAAGNRPTFRVVTGISAGAITAPFAFLGPKYDPQLKALATTVSDKDVFVLKDLLAILGSDSIATTRPLEKLLDRYYDTSLLRAIAAEHAKGRRLYVATCNLDAQRPVIWDMGAIASLGNAPEALKLFRRVILASAAIPVYFPPVYIQVEAGGKKYDEMHVDGGTIDQVILYGEAVTGERMLSASDDPPPPPPTGGHRPNVYIIRNAKIAPEPTDVRPALTSIADRAVATMTKAEGVGDLYRIYSVTHREGLEFKLAYLPDDFDAGHVDDSEGFDQKLMAQLFDLAYRLGRAGYRWHTEPPYWEIGKPPASNTTR
ncbi:MAG TPA: patatin-like phospholipase family protein [Tepidisphaeraceae bacterium]|jgi:predicted acylesterase/phospholipase RssA